MSKNHAKTRITLFLDSVLVEKFCELTTELGISRDALMDQTLPNELEYLQTLPKNSPRAARYLSNQVNPSGVDKRLNITINRGTAKSMNELCKEKGIPRDRFVSAYVDFLVKGDPEGACISPLVKAAELLRNPRHEYASSAGTNPYDELHIPEATVQALDELLGDLAGKGD